ncbi:MAG TPA: hypothetical protein VD926_05110 [Acidimicrobiales bacterium]|nr:hypothetical protein [Acidimicrobiales bacterium]
MSWFLRPDRWPLTPGDWLRVVDDLARAPTRVLLESLASVADGLVGKEVELQSANGAITLVVDAIVGAHSAPPVAMGALRPGLDLEVLESVDVDVSDVRWEGGRIDRVHVQAHDVNIEGGFVSELVAGPIGLVGEVDQATLDDLLDQHDVPIRVTLDGTDRATVHPGGRITATVSAELDGDLVRFPVHQVCWAGIRLPLVHRWVETRSATVPKLPRGMRLTGLSSSPGVVRATAVVDDFREPLVLESLLKAASSVGSHVVLSRVPRPR